MFKCLGVKDELHPRFSLFQLKFFLWETSIMYNVILHANIIGVTLVYLAWKPSDQ